MTLYCPCDRLFDAYIELAEKAREAKTKEDKKVVEDLIRKLKDGADFMTYQQALDYNSMLKIVNNQLLL